jgi:hypothetical protein
MISTESAVPRDGSYDEDGGGIGNRRELLDAGYTWDEHPNRSQGRRVCPGHAQCAGCSSHGLMR